MERHSPSTRKSYESAKNRYEKFCQTNQLTPLPASENQLCLFVSQLANEKLTHATIKCYLAAVRHAHIARGFGDPRINEMSRLEQVIKGIKAIQCRGGAASSRSNRLPTTPCLLQQMKQSWQAEGDGLDQAMLWAASLLCFFGFMRSGEITVPSESTYLDEGVHYVQRCHGGLYGQPAGSES